MKWGTGMLSSKEEKLSKNSGTERERVENLLPILSSASPHPLPHLIPAVLLLTQSGALMIMEDVIKEEKRES